MTWENQDDARVADTADARRRAVRHLDQHHAEARRPRRPADDVTEDDIERAIAEIQSAIKKVPALDGLHPAPFDRDRRASFAPSASTRRYTRHAEGSVLVEFGHTQVLCTASVEEKVPPFLKGKGTGLGHRRVRDAAARHQHAQRARGRARASSRAARRRSSASSAAACAR